MAYSEHEIDRILRVGFEAARKRRKRLTSVEKSNVLDCSRLWKERAHALSAEYPDVELIDMLVVNLYPFRETVADTIAWLKKAKRI